MDIFNRPPAIAEDTVHYTIYPPPDSKDKASVTTFAACISTLVDSLLPGFLWHRDTFELKVVSDEENQGWMLEGTVRVGDCIDDEWCIVWLLREISAKWDLAVSIFDSDGDFLLIEAAESLPSWVQPSNSENRVWIYQSHVHLIPLLHASTPSRARRRRVIPGGRRDEDEDNATIDHDDESYIAVDDALRIVRDPALDTLSPSQTEALIWRRISGYPEAAKQHVHHTNAYIPRDIAKALSSEPALIQKAVEAFYTRDAIQLRAAHRMSRFPPGTCLLTTVKMTRPAYAQLIGQKFFPPKVFGRWQEAESSKEWRWRDVGMKIAVGFEMLYQESKSGADNLNADGIQSSMAAKVDALRRTPDYVKYIENLVAAGYFRGEVEGSKLWVSLEEKAATTFVEARREDDATRRSFASLVNSAITSAGEPSLSCQTEDSDSWLDIDAANFEETLEQSTARPGKSNDQAMDVDPPEETLEDQMASEQASRLRNLAEQVEQFVEGEGDLEGARFQDEDFSDEEFSDEAMSEGSDNDDDEPSDAARQEAMQNLVPALDASEYGKMPASFHINSQKTAPTTIETEDVAPEPTEGPNPSKPLRKPILTRDKYDGVDSDDETDEEGMGDDSESEEDRPQVVGEIEVDMEEEEDDFLEFSRQALGISNDQWNEIIRDREGRGAFVPMSGPKFKESSASTQKKPATTGTSAPTPPSAQNTSIDSFEAVMQAMDAELARHRSQNSKGDKPADKGKGKEREKETRASAPDDEEDIESAMDAELKATLHETAGSGDDSGSDEDEPTDYGLIKNFLESFKSQDGLSGPVSNLAGRLQPGWNLPRDG
ncbi:SGT1 protein-domain-containing protein [Mycena floridula]|nr:SGT1 protein-domain-containing protein [Mycena floridula]